jgi:hypothetical protein
MLALKKDRKKELEANYLRRSSPRVDDLSHRQARTAREA